MIDEELIKKAFEHYCETDEGVMRFDMQLSDEWKAAEYKRWREAFEKASEK
jgi:hypothetical protein